jgi:hypothetical protein
MSDRPKPGKDKDLRLIRQAIDETDKFYNLLSRRVDLASLPEPFIFLAEAMLLVIDQLDLLDQMLDDPTVAPTQVIEYNRCLRNILRATMQNKPVQVDPADLNRMVQAVGDQLKSLLIVKAIRSND